MRLEVAIPQEAAAIAGVRNLAAAHLTERHGRGPWSRTSSARGVLLEIRQATVLVARDAGEIKATLTLATKKPWAIDATYFTACARAVYLTGMAVAPSAQRRGLGRACLLEAETIVRSWPADAIRLDAHDASGGAGEFYRLCGYREMGRVVYRGAPLRYFERFVASSEEIKMAIASPSVDHHFSGKSPVVRAIYDRLVAAAEELGPVEQEPKKTSIHLNRKTAFAGIATRREYLILTLKSATDIRSPRITKHERASANRWHLEIKLSELAEVDVEVLGWLRQAYEMQA